jgi:glyoxylase I family protein
MLKGFDHVALTVSNMDRSVHFYRDVIGMKEIQRTLTASGMTVVFVDAGGGMLELFMPPYPVSTPAPETPRESAGFRHICLIVDNLDAEYERLSALGVEFTELPRDARVSKLAGRLAFCKDPDGISIELEDHKS